MMIWLIAFILQAAWFAFMVFFPTRWANIVEKENSFWVNNGVIKVTTAEKIARFEKGRGLKVVIAIGTIFALLNAMLFN